MPFETQSSTTFLNKSIGITVFGLVIFGYGHITQLELQVFDGSMVIIRSDILKLFTPLFTAWE